MFERRKIVFGSYDTAAHGWTLCPGWALESAEQKTNYIDKPSGDGSWDLSTALTDGLPRFKDRKLAAAFECSEGDRMSREAEIRQMVNRLHGQRVEIELPDDPFHYLVGRLHVVREYNDLAHARVAVSAVCEPWKYAKQETLATFTLTDTNQTVRLANNGCAALVPTLTVSGGSTASANVTHGDSSAAFGQGAVKWPELVLLPGVTEIKIKGTGTLAISYREAVLE